jgi:hypothetical protein
MEKIKPKITFYELVNFYTRLMFYAQSKNERLIKACGLNGRFEYEKQLHLLCDYDISEIMDDPTGLELILLIQDISIDFLGMAKKPNIG